MTDWQAVGREAYAAGLSCVPWLDPAIRQGLAGLPVGSGAVAILRAWQAGWTAANLAAPVE